MKYVFLSNQFYQQYNSSNCPEIEKKQNRPYIMLLVKIEDLTFAIPFRSNIRHKYAFMTDKV
jgi:protein AbiQ